MHHYTYEEATRRNIGILTREEQSALSRLRVSIPGVGGLGGTQVMIMARLGIKHFNIADFDRYDASNLNRQYGATVKTLGQEKVDVMKEHIRSIHPDAEVTVFREGLTRDNVADFVARADIVLDAIDLTAMSVREALYAEARRQKKFVIACGPVGYGFFCITFDPEGASYESTFGITPAHSEAEKMQIFLRKLTPQSLHGAYMPSSLFNPALNDQGTANFSWISPAIFMAAGNGISELLKIVLKKGEVIRAPRCYQYDAFVNQLAIATID